MLIPNPRRLGKSRMADLGGTSLPLLEASLADNGARQVSIFYVWLRQEVWNQVPEVVHEVDEWDLGGKARAGDAHSLQHTTASQLMQHIHVLKVHGPATHHVHAVSQLLTQVHHG